MLLITDGGSTKCDWVLLSDSGEVVFKTTTLGLNPNVVSRNTLIERISDNPNLNEVKSRVETVDFYGAGCSTATPKKNLTEVLYHIFPNAKITVAEDMLAAALSVTQQPGIVCILGTGSNSCFFDGKQVHNAIVSLGYSVMDEASGNYFGKQLLRDYFYKKMPADLSRQFEKNYDLHPDTIKTNLYQQPNPNAYLASFSEFIFTTDDVANYFQQLLTKGIEDFITHRVLPYTKTHQVPVHFVGSIAYYAQNQIVASLKKHGLKSGDFTQRPIDGLINYYQNKQPIA